MDPLNPGTYVGQFDVEQKDVPEFANFTKEDWAMYFIERYGQIDGEQHKAWVLDQVARILKGTPVKIVTAVWSSGYNEFRVWTEEPSSAYHNWVKEMLGEEYDGEYEYDYDEGIAP